jgi:hypothetical protein
MLRWEVPIDGQPHKIDLAGVVMNVDTRIVGGATRLDFWTEVHDDEPTETHTFQVYGTGWEIPATSWWRGTAPRTDDGFVWHLYEHPSMEAE